jgi:predicted kinase
MQVTTLFLLCGKIAAGKSSLAQRLADRPATVLISEDHWTAHLFAGELNSIADYARCSARLRAAMGPHVVALLQAGMSVVLDFPANTRVTRRWMRSLIEEAHVRHELHVLDVPDEVCKERLRARNAGGEHPFQASDDDYETFTRYFAPPSEEEGFNVVVHAG